MLREEVCCYRHATNILSLQQTAKGCYTATYKPIVLHGLAFRLTTNEVDGAAIVANKIEIEDE